MSYKNPTLVELYAEFHLRPDSLGTRSWFELVPRLVAEGHKDIEFAGVFAVEKSELKNQARVRCWTPDKKRLIQVGQDIFIVNVVSPYLGWSDFVKFCKRAREIVFSTSEFPVESIVLVALDRLKVERANYSLDQYLDCQGGVVPAWYSDVREPIDITLGKGIERVDGFNEQVKIAVRVGEESVNLELKTVFHRRAIPEKWESVLEQLHDSANNVFEALITDRTRKEVMGGLT